MSAKILGRIIRPSTNTKGDYSQIENIQLQVFTAVDVPKNSPQGQTVQNSEELQKTQKLQLRPRLAKSEQVWLV